MKLKTVGDLKKLIAELDDSDSMASVLKWLKWLIATPEVSEVINPKRVGWPKGKPRGKRK